MPILYDEKTKQFHLQAGSSSYLFEIDKDAYLAHRYYGGRLSQPTIAQPFVNVARSFSPNPDPSDDHFSLDTLPQEYPVYGTSDFRLPALEAKFADGSTLIELRYQRHRIFPGKPALRGLPATYIEEASEATTLEVDLEDALKGLVVTLCYTAFTNHAVIARSVFVANHGTERIMLRCVHSAAMDLPDAEYDLIHLPGAHVRERELVRVPLDRSVHQMESRRGASSHQQNPFMALVRKNTTEEFGEAIGVSLVYSGNFQMTADVDQYDNTRVLAGINPFDFEWILEPGEGFQTPEALFVYSKEGLGGLSREFHRLIRTRLVRGKYRDQKRPVLINNWEATYFQFDQQTLLELGKSAKELGIELFVLDDGWFGHRDDDRSSLGDWTVDLQKLPDGLPSLVHAINDQGLRFGIWVEPEMISPDSELYRAHPDWCLHVPFRNQSLSRHQLVLDFSREEVCDAILHQLAKLLQSAPIRYVKWDMNRHISEVGSVGWPAYRQREVAHRYMLGLYRVLEQLTVMFPDILFESCSGGGGRFDPGMLYYMPQVWTSDNTDAISRLSIQFGTSLVYPAITMGSHVSAVPNHQVGRVTSIETRGFVAMMGNLGYELDARKLSEEERGKVQSQVNLYHEIQHIVLFGDLYRLRPPYHHRDAAWMYVSENKEEAFVTYVKILAVPNPPMERLPLQGLDAKKRYQVTLIGDEVNRFVSIATSEMEINGDELMQWGLLIPYLHGDFLACAWSLKAK